MFLHAGEKARKLEIHLCFETQSRLHKKSKTGAYVLQNTDLCPKKESFFLKFHLFL